MRKIISTYNGRMNIFGNNGIKATAIVEAKAYRDFIEFILKNNKTEIVPGLLDWEGTGTLSADSPNILTGESVNTNIGEIIVTSYNGWNFEFTFHGIGEPLFEIKKELGGNIEMGMSTHIQGFKSPDEKWRKMKNDYDACKKAGIDIPDEIKQYFGYHTPDDNGVEIDIKKYINEWRVDMCEGFEIDLTQLPKDIKIIRFYHSR